MQFLFGKKHCAIGKSLRFRCRAYTSDIVKASAGPNESCLFVAGSPTDTVDSLNFRTFSSRQIAFLVAELPMSALMHRLRLQCAGDFKVNPGPDSTPTFTYCQRLMQWNTSGMCGKSMNCRLSSTSTMSSLSLSKKPS